jgi:hypothetical protein
MANVILLNNQGRAEASYDPNTRNFTYRIGEGTEQQSIHSMVLGSNIEGVGVIQNDVYQFKTQNEIFAMGMNPDGTIQAINIFPLESPSSPAAVPAGQFVPTESPSSPAAVPAGQFVPTESPSSPAADPAEQFVPTESPSSPAADPAEQTENPYIPTNLNLSAQEIVEGYDPTTGEIRNVRQIENNRRQTIVDINDNTVETLERRDRSFWGRVGSVFGGGAEFLGGALLSGVSMFGLQLPFVAVGGAMMIDGGRRVFNGLNQNNGYYQYTYTDADGNVVTSDALSAEGAVNEGQRQIRQIGGDRWDF